MAMRQTPMEPGERDRIITIEERPAADAVDDAGTPIDGPWTTLVAEMPAARLDVQGGERFRSEQESARYDTRWEINYRADMDPDLVDVPKLRRIVEFGRTYDIESASVIGRRAGIELLTLSSTKVA